MEKLCNVKIKLGKTDTIITKSTNENEIEINQTTRLCLMYSFIILFWLLFPNYYYVVAKN